MKRLSHRCPKRDVESNKGSNIIKGSLPPLEDSIVSLTLKSSQNGTNPNFLQKQLFLMERRVKKKLCDRHPITLQAGKAKAESLKRSNSRPP